VLPHTSSPLTIFQYFCHGLLAFVAGQWLAFRQSRPDGEEVARAYSICSPPADNNRFALCLNRVQDGFMSNFLCDMKTGGEISLQGPFGDFILHPAAARSCDSRRPVRHARPQLRMGEDG
jgi:ferredoxin-NADP reductase